MRQNKATSQFSLSAGKNKVSVPPAKYETSPLSAKMINCYFFKKSIEALFLFQTPLRMSGFTEISNHKIPLLSDTIQSGFLDPLPTLPSKGEIL